MAKRLEPTDREVADFAAEHDCSMLEAREELRDEYAYAAAMDKDAADYGDHDHSMNH
jgi:hypothetical protein